MPPTYSMTDALRAADQAASAIEAYLRTRPETIRVTNVEADPVYQQIDVDLIWETQRATYKVEIKGDRLGHRTGNFFFETHSNKERGTPGCFLYSEADLLFYYFIETGKLYILPLTAARAWFLSRQDDFEERATHTPIQGVGEKSRAYTTARRLVPVERALREIPEVWQARLAAPDARPFLKWAGGKRQLLPQITAALPEGLATGKITRYVEPFVGSGAVFFRLARQFSFDRTLLADQNPELILAWRTLQSDVEALIAQLAALEQAYFVLDPRGQRQYFYETRAAFNSGSGQTPAARTAQLIFLNRTCYNGLFRVNASGQFNVPFGKYKNPTICDEANLRAASTALAGVELRHADFDHCRDAIDAHTFVYLDPPYRPLSPTASFNAYDKNGFDDQAQIRLAEFFREMDNRGARLMLSNSDPHNLSPHDNFFDDLYQGYRIQRIPASRNINSNPLKRGPITELLITNY